LTERLRVEARLLIPGSGTPIEDGCVVADGACIAYAGPRAGAPAGGGRVYRAEVVMPGMWDCHAHLLGMKTASLEDLVKVPLPVAAARCVADLGAALDAGVTSVREVGGLGVHLARVVDEGTVRGPSVYAAGALLSTTGGHADLHAYPVGCIADFAERGGCLQLCDGVSECLRGVRLQLRAGARLIKICASGGVMSERDHPLHQQFSDEELRAIVEEAARAERIVAAHCHGRAGIDAALRAGVRTIEHGSYLDQASAARMREDGVLLVTTRYIVTRLLDEGEKLGVPDYGMRKIRELADRHLEAIRIALGAGVKMAAGTDVGTSGEGTLAPWGAHGRELELLVAAGMTPLGAIEAATANGPLTLGPQAPRAGVLAAGFDADLLCLDADPLARIGVLAEPSRVRRVFKRGALVKDLDG
jgi:imidazolonepropionase-like amidohydrolase